MILRETLRWQLKNFQNQGINCQLIYQQIGHEKAKGEMEKYGMDITILQSSLNSLCQKREMPFYIVHILISPDKTKTKKQKNICSYLEQRFSLLPKFQRF